MPKIQKFCAVGAKNPILHELFFAPKILRGWSKEQFVQNRVWIEDNIQALEKDYPDQWVIVHEQKVVGADRKMGHAQDKAAQVIGNIFRADALMHFVEVTRRVYGRQSLWWR